MGKLTKEEVIAMVVLSKKKESKREIARRFGVAEGTVRYHIRRSEEGAEDGRKNKPMKAESHKKMIDTFMKDHPAWKEQNLRALHEELLEVGYTGSYRSVVRYIRRYYEKPRVRPYRRVETPPGVQAQTDWIEARVYLESEEGWTKVSGLSVKLSHSRGRALVWCMKKDLAHWLTAHNGAWVRLGGIPAVERVDNVKTAASTGAGPWATLHTVYGAYARDLKYHVEFCRVRTPRDKGKVERDVRFVRGELQLKNRRFRDLDDLQRYTDTKLKRAMHRLTCPVTGAPVWESFLAEQEVLTPLPEVMPDPFDVVVKRDVSRDCLVSFEGRRYSVPFLYMGRKVEVRGYMDETVRMVLDGEIVALHQRNTASRLLINTAHYEGVSTDQVIAPTPLGKNARKIEELSSEGVQLRAIEYYRALVEVQR